MKKLRLVLNSIFAGLFAVSLLAANALAINNPNSIAINSYEAFENIFENGDIMFTVRYNLYYASPPTETAPDAFLVNLLDETGAVILRSRQLSYYQHSVTSIYLTAAEVTSLGVIWGNAYKLRILGNPALFGSLVEGTNMVTKTMSADNWNPDGTMTSLELLGVWCIYSAKAISGTYVTSTVTGDFVLNSVGTPVFLTAIPDLIDVLPGIFQFSSRVPSVTPGVSTASYAIASRLRARMGNQIADAFSGIGTFLGIGDNAAGGLWAIIFILTVASIVFFNVGNSTGGMMLALPGVVLMTYLGAIPEAITYVIAIFIAAYAMYFFWLRGT